MNIWLQITSGSDKPIYAQIVEQISEAIAKGELSVGDKLPAVRKLSAELVINPNTVARAYNCLEQAGLVITRTGSGTFISDPKLRSRDAADINMLVEAMDVLITKGLNLGLEQKDILEMLKNRLLEFASKSKNKQRKK